MPLKNPAVLDKVVLKKGGSIKTEAGTTIVNVTSAGVVTLPLAKTGLTQLTFVGPTTADYAIQDVTDTGGFGLKTAEEARTFISVVAGMQAALKSAGITS
jgi:hypothetical protein